jgi:hypothetical protein
MMEAFNAAITEWHRGDPYTREIQLSPHELASFSELRQNSGNSSIPKEASLGTHAIRLFWGELLFKNQAANSPVANIRIPNPDAPSAIVGPRSFATPQSYSRYDDTGPVLGVNPQCNQNSSYAILLHEPHSSVSDQQRLFLFLKFLQDAYPSSFPKLNVFQEGQLSKYFSFGALPHFAPSKPPSNVDALIDDSQRQWQSTLYDPLNKTIDIANSDALIQSLMTKSSTSKIIPKIDSNNGTIIRKALAFYKSFNADGSLNTASAVLEVVQQSQNPQAKLVDRLKNLEPSDSSLSRYLIDTAGLRGALAYELYANGKRPASDPSSKIEVFGIEDPGIYLASCFLQSQCVSSLGLGMNDDAILNYDDYWTKIQPYRDWLMAQSVLLYLKDAKQGVIPIILAALPTHLPLVRDILCREGNINTVSLDYTDHTSAISQFFTTPLMPFLQATYFDVSTLAPTQMSTAVSGNSQEFYSVLDAFEKAR